MTVDEIREILKAGQRAVALKYVRVNGEYRFADTTLDHVPDHIDMLNPGEVADSAAYLAGFENILSIKWNSSSLRIGPAPDDLENLTRLLIE